MGRMAMFAAMAVLMMTGCAGDDACMQFCQTSISCNEESGTDAWQQEVDDCYAEYENQGLGTAALDASWKATCQTSLDNWPGCTL